MKYLVPLSIFFSDTLAMLTDSPAVAQGAVLVFLTSMTKSQARWDEEWHLDR